MVNFKEMTPDERRIFRSDVKKTLKESRNWPDLDPSQLQLIDDTILVVMEMVYQQGLEQSTEMVNLQIPKSTIEIIKKQLTK